MVHSGDISVTGFGLRCGRDDETSFGPISDLGTDENDGCGERGLIAGRCGAGTVSVNSAPSVTIGDVLPLRVQAPTGCTLLVLAVGAEVLVVVGSGGTGLRMACGAGGVGRCSDMGGTGGGSGGAEPLGSWLGTKTGGGNFGGANCGASCIGATFC